MLDIRRDIRTLSEFKRNTALCGAMEQVVSYHGDKSKRRGRRLGTIFLTS